MNLTKKNIQKTSGIRRLGKFYKPGQLVTIDRHVYRITKTNELCLCCFDGNYEKFDFCMELPIGLSIKPIKKHKG